MDQGLSQARSSGINSRRRKYFKFAAKHDSPTCRLIPIFPLTQQKIMLYALYLAKEGNVTGGFKSVNNYLAAIISLGRSKGFNNDPRTTDARGYPCHNARQAWTRFKARFNTDIPTIPKGPQKLAMQPKLFKAMLENQDTTDGLQLRQAALYSTLFWSGARAGHFTIHGSTNQIHILTWKQMLFHPSVRDASLVMLHFTSTKTRPHAQGHNTFAQSIGTLRSKQWRLELCPVNLLRLWYYYAYKGNPDAPIFAASTNSSKPLQRTSFVNTLRRDVAKATVSMGLAPGAVNAKAISCISFRKGCLTSLCKVTSPLLVAAHADHADPRSTLNYVKQSAQDRANHVQDVTDAFFSQLNP